MGREDLYPKAVPVPGNHWARAFIDVGRGHIQNNTTSSDSHLEIGHWWSDQHHLMVLSTVNIQFHGCCVPISLR